MIHTLYEPWFSVGKLFSLKRMKAGTFKKVEQARFYGIFRVLPRANLKHASLLLHKFLSQSQGTGRGWGEWREGNEPHVMKTL